VGKNTDTCQDAKETKPVTSAHFRTKRAIAKVMLAYQNSVDRTATTPKLVEQELGERRGKSEIRGILFHNEFADTLSCNGFYRRMSAEEENRKCRSGRLWCRTFLGISSRPRCGHNQGGRLHRSESVSAIEEA